MKLFDVTMTEIFEERAGEFSPDLREMLQHLWSEGVKTGLYLERERVEVPPEVFAPLKGPRKPVPTDDVRRVPGRMRELEQARDDLVEKAEELALCIEKRIDPAPTLALGGVELTKARHRYLTQVDKIARDLAALRGAVDRFKVHSY